MNRTQAVERMQETLGFTASLEQKCISALQEAQRLLEKGRSLPDFLKVEDEAFVAPVGSDEVPLPTGFIREAENESLHFVTDSNAWSFLEKTEYMNLKNSFEADASGRPYAYALRKETVAFGPPTRDEEYTLYWTYYKQSVSLSSDTSENEWLQEDTGNPEALIGRAGMIVAADARDTEAFAIFKAMYEDAWRGAISDSILREEADRVRALGEFN